MSSDVYVRQLEETRIAECMKIALELMETTSLRNEKRNVQ